MLQYSINFLDLEESEDDDFRRLHNVRHVLEVLNLRRRAADLLLEPEEDLRRRVSVGAVAERNAVGAVAEELDRRVTAYFVLLGQFLLGGRVDLGEADVGAVGLQLARGFRVLGIEFLAVPTPRGVCRTADSLNCKSV